MNDQMYKQNRRVMDERLGRGGVGRVGRKQSLSLASSSGPETGMELERPGCRIVCRVLLQFVFSQVGVGGLVVCYTILGAAVFQALETGEEREELPAARAEAARTQVVGQLWELTSRYNTLNKLQWVRATTQLLHTYQQQMVNLTKEGYDSQTLEDRWTFPNALMFSLSVISTIGYGNLVPVTQYGKLVLLAYAVIGIPVFVLYLRNMGQGFKWGYSMLLSWSARRAGRETGDWGAGQQQLRPPSTACIWLLMLYLALGTLIFSSSEGWSYLDSAYFCLTSLLKIGFGDFVPGAAASAKEVNFKLYVDYCYLLCGMAVVAMCYYLLKEEVTRQVGRFKQKITERCRKLKIEN